MNRRYLIALVAAASLFMIVFGPRRSYPEYIFLKDGKIVQGNVIGDTAAGITVREKGNKVTAIPRNTVSRVIYTDLYLGKLYVRLTDGNSFLGFMVDEDASSYTFRKELQSPEEFRVNRKSVLFTARRNPTDLKARAGDDRVELQWNAPYNRVSDYRIYRKGPEDKDFAMVDTSGDTSETVSGLKSSTSYKFYVTAVDTDDEESLPSDMITVVTKNIPPRSPGDLKAVIEPDRARLKMNVRLTWEKSEDPDGTVAHYNVYLKAHFGTKLQGKTRQTAYALQRLDLREKYQAIVRAVDNAGTESEDAAVLIEHEEPEPERPAEPAGGTTPSMPGGILQGHLYVGLYGSYLLPLHEDTFDRIADPGFGILVSAEYRDLFLAGLSAGLETGYLYFTGDTDLNKTIRRHMMVPLYPVVRYEVRVYDQFYVSPEAGFGMSWSIVQYREKEYTDLRILASKQKDRVLPLFTGGLALSYRGLGHLSVTAGARYYGVIDPEMLIDFMMFYAGAGYSF